MILSRSFVRDIGGSDPERMAAPRVAQYVEEIFADEKTKVSRKLSIGIREIDVDVLDLEGHAAPLDKAGYTTYSLIHF